MSLLNYARQELELINKSKDEMQNMMDAHILKMVEVFADEGHSGFSASYAINVLERLLRFKPLSPLTGEDDEWNEVSADTLQNKRCSSVFCDRKTGECYDIDGRCFSDDGGESWYNSFDSRVKVEFPYNVPTHIERVILDNKEDSK